jgi:hypothetical protein
MNRYDKVFYTPDCYRADGCESSRTALFFDTNCTKRNENILNESFAKEQAKLKTCIKE